MGRQAKDDDGSPAPRLELPVEQPLEPRPQSSCGCLDVVAADKAAPDEQPVGARENAAVTAAAAPPEAALLPAPESSVLPQFPMSAQLDIVAVAVVVVFVTDLRLVDSLGAVNAILFPSISPTSPSQSCQRICLA